MDLEGLSAICASLGTVEDDDDGKRIGYVKDEYCLDNLKDLLRFLRRDDPEKRDVFKQVSKWNIVSKDLIPIIEHCQDDHNLVLNAVKVLVFLSMPVEPSSNDVTQQTEYLWELKLAVTCSDAVAVILSLLETPLENLQTEVFTEGDWKLVQLVLTLFRNVLAVQDISVLQKASGSATHFLSLRDNFIELLFRENVMDLIVVLTQHVGGSSSYLHQDNLLLLETFHYIFMGQDAELIARAHLKDSKAEQDASLNTLKYIIEEEEEKRRRIRLQNVSRHSQFSGTFTRVNMDGSNKLFKGNPTSASCDTLLGPQKVQRGPLKRIVWDHATFPSSKSNIPELLHDFTLQFVSGGYNVLMQSLREDIEKEHHSIQNCDIVVFFRVAQFIMSFQYHKLSISQLSKEAESDESLTKKDADITLFNGDICGPIAASMNESMFLLVMSKWRNAFEGLKETNDYKFLSAAGSLMKTMLRMLELVLKLSPKDSKEPQIARILLYKLFYDQTEEGMTHFLLNLMKSFDTHKQPRSDLADLVEMIHTILWLMESLEKRGTLRVSKKSRKKKQRKMASDAEDIGGKQNGDNPTGGTQYGISGCENSNSLGIPQLGNSSNAGSAPKNGDISHADVDGPQQPIMETSDLADNVQKEDNGKSDSTNNDLDCGSDDSFSDEESSLTYEVDFKVSTLVSAFANSFVIHNLCWLLKFYKSNAISTNHHIIRMFQRICEDLELSPMFYQLSFLTLFHNILVEQKTSPCKDYENIVTFLSSLVRRMLRKMKSQPLLFVYILFWKTRRECNDISADSLLQELGGLKREIGNWENAPDDGFFGSSQGFGGRVHRSLADALGDDEADVVISHEIYNQREEGTVTLSSSDNDRKGNSDNSAGLKSSKRKKRPILKAGLERKVKDLYEKYKGDKHCSRLIAEALEPDEKVSPFKISSILKRIRNNIVDGDDLVTKSPNQLINGKAFESDHPSFDSKDSNRSLKRTLNSRKRVCAFSKEQETMIRTLFDKFKGHKRCSYMIANALDADRAFSTSQISHKLKQLGLLVSQKRTFESNTNLVDENSFDSLSNITGKSDDETLQSLIKRRKSLLRKGERVAATSHQGSGKEADSGNGLIHGDLARHEQEQATEMEGVDADEALELNRPDVEGMSLDEATPSSNVSHSPTQPSYAELEDEMLPAASPQASIRRRRTRMVLDLEDEDE